MAGYNDGLCNFPSSHAVYHGDADGGQPGHHSVSIRGPPHSMHFLKHTHACGEHVLLDLFDLPDARCL